MNKTALMAAIVNLVFQGSLSMALCGSPESFHRPSGLPSGQYWESGGGSRETTLVFYGNGNPLMNQKLFNSLTSSFNNGQKFVNMEYERNKASELFGPAAQPSFQPMFR